MLVCLSLWGPSEMSSHVTQLIFLPAGVSALSAQLAKLPMGLKYLNLSRTSMSPKGGHTEEVSHLF